MLHFFPSCFFNDTLFNLVLFQDFIIKCHTIFLLHYFDVALVHIALLMLHYLLLPRLKFHYINIALFYAALLKLD